MRPPEAWWRARGPDELGEGWQEVVVVVVGARSAMSKSPSAVPFAAAVEETAVIWDEKLRGEVKQRLVGEVGEMSESEESGVIVWGIGMERVLWEKSLVCLKVGDTRKGSVRDL